jgi:CRP-like cAMP-binding protein
MNKIRKKWYIDNHALYSSLSNDVKALLVQSMEITDFKPGQRVFKNQDPIKYVSIIKHGELFLYHTKNKKRIIFDTLTPGDIVGALMPNLKKMHYFGQAGHGGVCFCQFPKELFWSIAETCPQMLLTMNKYLFEKQAGYQTKFETQQNKADELIFHELLRLQVKKQKGFIGKFINRPLRITHEEIAERTGLNRVTVTRAMKTLKTKNKIQVDPKTGIINITEEDYKTIE